MSDILFRLYFIFTNFFKTEIVFWVFLFKSMRGEWRGYSCSKKIWEGFKVKCIRSPGWKQMETHRTLRNGPILNQLSILYHRQSRTKMCNRHIQKHHHKHYTWQLSKLWHQLFQRFHSRNQPHHYLTTKWIISPQKVYTSIGQPNPKSKHHHHLSCW